MSAIGSRGLNTSRHLQFCGLIAYPDASSMKKYMCLICGWIYDEETGWPEDGLKAGTLWNDVPMNWTCPECGARKDDFEMVEI